MTLDRPIPMQASGSDTPFVYTAAQIRAGLVGSIYSREGVVGPEYGNLRLDQRGAGANFSIDIYPGRCAIQGDDSSDQGIYICNNTAVENRTTPQPPGSGTRRHRVIARVRDRAHNTAWAAGTYDWLPEILPDVGGGTPAEPPSAITLGFVRMRAGQASVQTSDIDTEPTRATVGTPDRSGTWTVLNDYLAEDASRPLRYSINSDGWVSLAGFIRFKKPNAPLYKDQSYQLTDVPLPSLILPKPAAYRDTIGITSFGHVHLAVMPSGHLFYRVFGDLTLVQNVAWWSFDGVGWKL